MEEAVSIHLTEYHPAVVPDIRTGSVGMFAIQLAHAAGYKVVTTASPRNHELCKSLGADAVFDVSIRLQTIPTVVDASDWHDFVVVNPSV